MGAEYFIYGIIRFLVLINTPIYGFLIFASKKTATIKLIIGLSSLIITAFLYTLIFYATGKLIFVN